MQAEVERKQAEIPMYFKSEEGGDTSEKRCRIETKILARPIWTQNSNA
ncbi:MAG: hypothetical protein ACUVUU_09750 [bacterium]